MKNLRMFSAQFIFVFRIALILTVCGALAVSQESRFSKGQRTLPASQGATPNGGTLQTAQPDNALRAAIQGNDVEQMTAAHFRVMPDSAMLRFKGESLTKSAFVGQRLKELQLQAKSALPEGTLSFEALQARFQQKQAAALAQKNARVETLMQAANARSRQLESSSAFLALAKESGEIEQRYSGANSTQQLQLKQRALELHNQLLKLEREDESQDRIGPAK